MLAGDCGTKANTAQLVKFGSNNSTKITRAADGVVAGGRPTLERGIVQAIEDFSGPFARNAKQVNRIIVVTRHGVDACDQDTQFVNQEIQDRLTAAHLQIDFRFIGYQVKKTERDQLNQIASGVRAPAPAFVAKPADLQTALSWYTNVQPVLRDSSNIITALNSTVTQINGAVQSIQNDHLDTAQKALDQATSATKTKSDVQFEDLIDRPKTTAAKPLYDRAISLRAQQRRVLDAATVLLASARSKSPTSTRMTAFESAAGDYNTAADQLNHALNTLLAQAPRGLP